MTRFALAVGALLVALTGCETASCPSNLIQTPSGSCECPPGLRWSEMARACVDSPDGSVACSRDAECDDGAYCNGGETCSPGATGADVRGCLPGTPPCPGFCSEARRECTEECADDDGDGHADVACGGDDCDDTDERRYPGNTEVCDGMTTALDEDCDPTTLGDDADADRYVSDRCCNRLPAGRIECGTDCNDASSDVNPEAIDTCGGGDQDCDGRVDENPDQIFYRDVDGDGHGVLGDEDPSEADDPVYACSAPPGYAVVAGDCDDTQGGINPGVGELCVGMRDEDCDGAIDEGCPCVPEGGTRSCGPAAVGVCLPGIQRCTASGWDECSGFVAPSMEICEGARDENCDDRVDEGCECTNGDTRRCGIDDGECSSVLQTCGMGRWPRDCAAEPGVITAVPERCDGARDEDCDGATDEGCECVDGTFTPCGSSTGDCRPGMRGCTSGRYGACTGGVTPRAETCDGSRDEDCDGRIDESCPCSAGQMQPCGTGYCAGTQTCNSAGVWSTCTGPAPRAEVCNGIDDDCDGIPDTTDTDVAMLGATCGTSVGLCNPGRYSCNGSMLVCGGSGYVASTAEICDHRDQDCNGTLDDNVGVAACSSTLVAVSTSTELRDGCHCFPASCATYLASGNTLMLADGSPPRAALRGALGSSVDFGERMTITAGIGVNRRSSGGGDALGRIGVVISPVDSAGTAADMGLPRPPSGRIGYAALYNPAGFSQRVEIYELTSGGPVLRAASGVISCYAPILPAAPQYLTITFEANAGSFTASIEGSGCGVRRTVSWSDSDWQQLGYGDSETTSYPRYYVGLVGYEQGNFRALANSLAIDRPRTTARSHCVACPW